MGLENICLLEELEAELYDLKQILKGLEDYDKQCHETFSQSFDDEDIALYGVFTNKVF